MKLQETREMKTDATTFKEKENPKVKLFGKIILPILLLALSSVSCGTGDGGGAGSQTASGGIGGTGVSQGPITDFGSIIRGDSKFNTDDAIFLIDDQPGKQEDLSIGQVVKIRVDDSGNKATEVEYEAEVEGPIDHHSKATRTLVALGRTIIVDEATIIEDDAKKTFDLATFFDTSKNDDMLEVSGLVFSGDNIQATHIKKISKAFDSGVTELELKGRVLALDQALQSFKIGGQVVNYSDSTIFERMKDESELTEGLLVEVKGTRGKAGTPLLASRIQKEDSALGVRQNDNVEIQGLVTAPLSSNTFSVNSQAIETRAATVYERGAPDDITLNIRLEVEGHINAAGVLVAKKVKFHGNRIKIEANVSSVQPENSTMTLLGKVQVVANGATVGALSLSSIERGDRLEIRGYLWKEVMTATRIEQNNGDQGKPVRLQAPVESLDNSSFSLLGVKVTTSITTEFEDRQENIISAETFFGQVKPGDLVKAKGAFSGEGIIASEVEFEN